MVSARDHLFVQLDAPIWNPIFYFSSNFNVFLIWQQILILKVYDVTLELWLGPPSENVSENFTIIIFSMVPRR